MLCGSCSFGCAAVFLLGGETRNERPTALFVRSGDVLLMSRRARHCYHGAAALRLHASGSRRD
jgi:alkylated DNA repair protein alkB family protein 1